MADTAAPNRVDKDKAEGERSTAEQNAGRNTDVPNSESSTDRKYNTGIGDNTGGITNRPLDEEVENQNTLPDRGTSQDDERKRQNEDMER